MVDVAIVLIGNRSPSSNPSGNPSPSLSGLFVEVNPKIRLLWTSSLIHSVTGIWSGNWEILISLLSGIPSSSLSASRFSAKIGGMISLKTIFVFLIVETVFSSGKSAVAVIR